MTEQEIRELFKTKNVPLGREDVWKVQNALVIKHSALERLAAEMGVRWQPPQILRSERDEAVILVTGSLVAGDGHVTAQEWSIGEALIGANYRVSGKQAAYVWAMAEKRAKDRVILKLAKLHGAYSEDEADDFKQSSADAEGQPGPVGRDVPPPQRKQAVKTPAEEQVEIIRTKTMLAALDKFRSLTAVKQDFNMMSPEDQAWVDSVDQTQRDAIAAGLPNLMAG